MALSLQALLDRAEAFCAERESLRARAAPATPLPFRSLFAEFSELSREETLAFARSHPAAFPLVPFLARCCEEADALEVSERIDTVERTGSISLGEGTLPFRAARERMARETDRPARAAVARGLDRFLWEQRDAYAARCRRATETAARLGFDTYAAFREQAGLQARLPLEELSTFLRLTEDAYRDVLGYALKKLGADVRALPSGSAQLHDALAAMNAPWMAAHFRREDAGGALDRT
ncbi:MAG TPA: hypothetical protein VEY30_06965, partial [Myxococcaceae bacterium]|nr:hypothetical protein [Myxococcaceae bacterium]